MFDRHATAYHPEADIAGRLPDRATQTPSGIKM
jgi:hypothetical protein